MSLVRQGIDGRLGVADISFKQEDFLVLPVHLQACTLGRNTGRAGFSACLQRALKAALGLVLIAHRRMPVCNLWSTVYMSEDRLSPQDYKELMKEKGWTGRALALRWRKTAVWISKVINDEDREPHWDDALRGLPKAKRKPPKKVVS